VNRQRAALLLCNPRHRFSVAGNYGGSASIKVRLVTAIKLYELSAGTYKTQAEAQTEKDIAMIPVWLMLCLINAVLPFGLY
jgi:hypothetical protein